MGVAHDHVRSPTVVASPHRPVTDRVDGRATCARLRRAAVAVVGAYAVLTVSFLLLGFMLTKLFDTSLGVWDERVNGTLVHDRTHAWNMITSTSTSVMNTTPAV